MKRTYFKKTKKLFAGLNAEKASGLSFSAAIVGQYIFLLIFLLAARLCGGLKEGYQAKDWFLYCSYLIPQAAFAATAYLYFSRTETRVKDVAKKPRAIYFCIAITLQLGLLSLSSVNGLFLKWLEKFGYTPASPAVPSMNGAKIIPAILVIAVLPACFEELFFRGILFCGMKKFGAVAAVLASAGLFALYHQSPAQTIYQFVCGACFALIALRSGSILPTVVSHFVNNALILILEACGVQGLPLWLLIAFGVLLAGSLAYLLCFDGHIDGVVPEKSEEMQTVEAAKPKADAKGFVLYALTGIILCALNWISALVA